MCNIYASVSYKVLQNTKSGCMPLIKIILKQS